MSQTVRALHSDRWRQDPQLFWLLEPLRYEFWGRPAAQGGPVWFAVRRPVSPPAYQGPGSFPEIFATLGPLVTPYWTREDAARFSSVCHSRSLPAQPSVVGVVAAIRAADPRRRGAGMCDRCPDVRPASYECDICHRPRCEQCSTELIARPIWMEGIAPRGLVVCRQFRLLATGRHGFRTCTPAPCFPHGFATWEGGAVVDALLP